MNLPYECNELMKTCGFPYVICGGYALELYLNKRIRSHSDIDVSIYEDDKADVVEFLISNGWNVYEHKFDWIDNKKTDSYLRIIIDANDNALDKINQVWAIKPDCSFIDIAPKTAEGIFSYEITKNEQLIFDYIGVSFNKLENGHFVIDPYTSQEKYITREIEKAVLFNDNGIPYLAPEIILLMNSPPAYLQSEYHRKKSMLDFDTVAPMLCNESREWLIKAIETAYPNGLERLNRLKRLGDD